MIARNYIFGRKYMANFIENLVAYYPLNGNSNEAINGLNGTDTGISYVAGNVDLGANFLNNTTSRITIADTNFLSFTDGVNDVPLTFVFSAKKTITGNTDFLFSKSDRASATNREYACLLFNSKVRFVVYTNSTNFLAVEGNTVLTLNVWHNIVVTYDASETVSGVKIYVDGVLQTLTNISTGTYTGMNNTTITPLIGSVVNNTANQVIKGVIDEVYIYKNRVFDSFEVSQVYHRFQLGATLI